MVTRQVLWTRRRGRFDPSEPFHMSTRRAARNPNLTESSSAGESSEEDDNHQGQSFDKSGNIDSSSTGLQTVPQDHAMIDASMSSIPCDIEMPDVVDHNQDTAVSDSQDFPTPHNGPTSPSRKRKRSSPPPPAHAMEDSGLRSNSLGDSLPAAKPQSPDDEDYLPFFRKLAHTAPNHLLQIPQSCGEQPSQTPEYSLPSFHASDSGIEDADKDQRKVIESQAESQIQSVQSPAEDLHYTDNTVDGDEDVVDAVDFEVLSDREVSRQSSQSSDHIPSNGVLADLSIDATPHISGPGSPETPNSIDDFKAPLAKPLNAALEQVVRTAQLDEIEVVDAGEDVEEVDEVEDADEGEEHARWDDEGRPRRRFGGRRRAAHPIPRVEAHMRRQAQNKSAYRAIARAQKAILAEIAGRTIDDLKANPELHLQVTEYAQVKEDLANALALRKRRLAKQFDLNVKQLREKLNGESEVVRKQYHEKIEELRNEYLENLELQMLRVVRAARVGEAGFETEDEDDVVPKLKGMAYGWKRSSALEDSYDSRSRKSLQLRRQADDLTKRMELQELIDEFTSRDKDSEPWQDKESPRHFTVMDSGPRDYALARRQGAADFGTLAAAAAEVERIAKMPVIRNEDAHGLQLLGDLSTRPSIAAFAKAINDQEPSDRDANLQPPQLGAAAQLTDQPTEPIALSISPRTALVVGNRFVSSMPPSETPILSSLSIVRSPRTAARYITPKQHTTLTFVRSPELSKPEPFLPPPTRIEPPSLPTPLRPSALPASRPTSHHSHQSERIPDPFQNFGAQLPAHTHHLSAPQPPLPPAGHTASHRSMYEQHYESAEDYARQLRYWQDLVAAEDSESEMERVIIRHHRPDLMEEYWRKNNHRPKPYPTDPALGDLDYAPQRPADHWPSTADTVQYGRTLGESHVKISETSQRPTSAASVVEFSATDLKHDGARWGDKSKRGKSKSTKEDRHKKDGKAENVGGSGRSGSLSGWPVPPHSMFGPQPPLNSPFAPSYGCHGSPHEQAAAHHRRQSTMPHYSPQISTPAPVPPPYQGSPYEAYQQHQHQPPAAPALMPPSHHFPPPPPPSYSSEQDYYYKQYYRHNSYPNGHVYDSYAPVPPPPPPPGWNQPLAHSPIYSGHQPPPPPPPPNPHIQSDYYSHYAPPPPPSLQPPPGYQLVTSATTPFPPSSVQATSSAVTSRQPAATDSYGQQYGGPPIAPATPNGGSASGSGRPNNRMPAFAQRGNAPSTYRRRNTGDGFQVHKFHNYTPSSTSKPK